MRTGSFKTTIGTILFGCSIFATQPDAAHAANVVLQGLIGPQKVTQGACSGVYLVVAHSSTVPLAPYVNVGLSTSKNGGIFSDPECKNKISSIAVSPNIFNGRFFYKNEAVETDTITALDNGQALGSLNVVSTNPTNLAYYWFLSV